MEGVEGGVVVPGRNVGVRGVHSATGRDQTGSQTVSDRYLMCSHGRWSPGLVAAGGVGRCRQCSEAWKFSVWTDYEPPAPDCESTQSCRSAKGAEAGQRRLTHSN